MHFNVRKRRNTPTVIIVALVDVLVVLLIFLMVTTTFKQQPTLKLALPESSQAQKEGGSKSEPPFLVSIESTGGLRAGQNADPVTQEQLQDRLRDAVAKNPQLKLVISADKTAPWGKIIAVMNIAKELKIKSVSASTAAAKEVAKP